ncbi:MAG: L-threonylcarbamoyladenylate synthase [Burkholderiales bacterium]|nr:L-threonylcarbamoyladenylate synthase [Burkholderiales bacterium]
MPAADAPAVPSPDAAAVAEAVAVLRAGGLVAFPTETVWGLGADAAQPAAVARIFAAKGRPADHPVIVHTSDAARARQWAAAWPDAAQRLADAFWPGPLTLIVPRAAHVADIVTGGQAAVGVRVPAHPVAQALLAAFGGGVAAPSANRFGRLSPTSAAHVRDELGAAVDHVLDVPGAPDPAVGIESAIVDVSRAQPVLLRPGMIGRAALEAALGACLATPDAAAPRASGTLASHYAPRTPTVLVPSAHLTQALQADDAVLARRAPAGRPTRAWIAAPADAAAYAHALYANLRTLDASGAARLVVEAVPDSAAWEAVRDRLARAAHRAEAADAPHATDAADTRGATPPRPIAART